MASVKVAGSRYAGARFRLRGRPAVGDPRGPVCCAIPIGLLRGAGEPVPQPMMVPGPLCEIGGPLFDLVKIDAATSGRSVAVIIPELVLRRWGSGCSMAGAPRSYATR
ncbi:hypothetical protein ACMGDM_06570 [Sphingomonas sp. DT-51]|uniref:hypothetical protein n=1 Tax=Sphingomonas sp. DT-51 TaxID=3396165 RepID=UPI003F1CE714